MQSVVIDKIKSEIEATEGMGNIRLFKFVQKILGSKDATKQFLLSQGYLNWEVNKIVYDINYNKIRYKRSKIINN